MAHGTGINGLDLFLELTRRYKRKYHTCPCGLVHSDSEDSDYTDEDSDSEDDVLDNNFPIPEPITPVNTENYKYFGLEKSLKRLLKNMNFSNSNVQLNIHIDQCFLHKLFNKDYQFWPIMAWIHETSTDSQIFVGGYVGNKKPKVEKLLEPLLQEMTTLQKDGMTVGNHKFIVKIRTIICKTGVRSFLQRTKLHTQLNSCSKCTSPGVLRNGKVIFLENNAPLRNDEDFANQVDRDHHCGVSPLATSGLLGMVSQMPLDFMDICHGVLKRLFKLWMNSTEVLQNYIKKEDMKKIVQVYHKLTCSFPKEYEWLKHKVLLINENIDTWRSSVFYYFFLYLAPVMLANYLPPHLLDHFQQLHSAIWILRHPELSKSKADEVQKLILDFVDKFKKYYGEDNLTFSVHSLIHLKNDVDQLGQLKLSHLDLELFISRHKDSQTENEIETMTFKPMRFLEMFRSHNDIIISGMNKKMSNNVVLPKPVKSIRNHLPFGCTDAHRDLIFENFVLSVKDSDNCCYLKNGKVVMIKFIGFKDKQVVVVGSTFKVMTPLPVYNSNAENFGFFIAEGFNDLNVYPADEVKCKAMIVPFSVAEKFAVYPMV